MSNDFVADSKLRILSTNGAEVKKTVAKVERITATTDVMPYVNPNTVKLTLGKLGVDSENNPPGPPSIPVTNGLIARYNASSFNTGTQTWEDLINSYDAPVSRGTVSVGTSPVGGDPVVYGGTGDGITWPTGILPSTFTIFHVSRYRDGTRGRIWQGQSNNWLDGFHGNKAGCAFHDGWIANSGTDVFGYNWVLSTSQNSLYRGEGTTYGTSGGSSSTRLTINHGLYSEYSDWEVAELIVFDRHLSSAEYISVEGWLAAIYPNSTTVTASVSGNYVGYTAVSTQEQIYNVDPNYTLPSNVSFYHIESIPSTTTYLNTAITGLKTKIRVDSNITSYSLSSDTGATVTNTRSIISDVAGGGGGGGGEVVVGPTQTWY